MGSSEDISIENISKIEGHSHLDISIKNGEVQGVKLGITESKRFYTQAIRGKAALSLPLMTSRICGTCSIAHLSCCSDAVENAIGYEPSEQTVLLRKLSMYGMMIRDHAMHLYLFCLPDIFGKDSVLDFGGRDEEIIRHAFAVKSAGNNLSKMVAGRAIHATFAEVGKFSHVPESKDVKAVINELKAVRGYAIDFIKIFYDKSPVLERDADFVSLVSEDYSFNDGNIEDSRGFNVLSHRYSDYVNMVVIPYSEASGYEFEGKEHMVGALARMNLNKRNLHRDTVRDSSGFLNVFPSKNIFNNNLAQAIEILHCIDHSIELLESNDFKQENSPQVVIRPGIGVGLLEAPRGTLYYMVDIDETGKVREGKIITPTQQNQISMEKAIGELVGQRIGEKDKKEIEHEVEELVRAYDPCMSCASHFLRINWRESRR
jgi:sulfhydrogenase subunit alpha